MPPAGADVRVQATLIIALCSLLAACAAPARVPNEQARLQVMETERAFARTMTERNLDAFGTFVSDDAVFFSGPTPLHGKAAVVDWWARFYKNPAAPFSWEPEQVEVLASGDLALSTGPVRDAKGKLIAHFTSIWRLEAPGRWRIVFDKGAEVCDCAKQ
jgi:ketosteroid isomerase-like protein